MKNPETREMMAELYRLIEKHEEPIEDSDYWDSLVDGSCKIHDRHPSRLAFHLVNGLLEGMRETLAEAMRNDQAQL